MGFLKEFTILLLCTVSPLLSKPMTTNVDPLLLIATGTQDEGSQLVKRQTFALSDFIGNVETGLVQSALSVSSLLTDPSLTIAETVPSSDDHSLRKRSTEISEKSTTEAVSPTVLLQTTEKVPEGQGIPAHIVVDRISVYPLPVDSIPLIPTFQLVAVRKESEEVETSTRSTENSSSEESSEATTVEDETTTTVAPKTTTTTTPKAPIADLKEAEEELKEKVAEIEADPVIFSSRV